MHAYVLILSLDRSQSQYYFLRKKMLLMLDMAVRAKILAF